MRAIRWLIWALPLMVPPCLAGQTLGIPLSYRPMMRGFGAAIDAGADKGGFRTIALTGIVAIGHITGETAPVPLLDLSGTVARVSEEGDAGAATADVGVEISLLGSFAVGVDRSRWGGVKRTYVPLAAALPLVACGDPKHMLFVYGVPIWSFERLEQPRGARWQSSWGSVNLGALLELRSGLGFQLGVGGLFQHATDDPYRRVVISAGVHLSTHGILQAAPGAEPGRGGCALVL